MHVSRSRLFILAVKDYLKKYENKDLLAQINAACDDISSIEEEVKIVQAIKRKQKENIRLEMYIFIKFSSLSLILIYCQPHS